MALTVALTPGVGLGQAEVIVTSSEGGAVDGARVELWGGASLVVTRTTDESGVARFSVGEIGAAATVTVRRVGFSPAFINLAGSTSRIEVKLERLIQSIPALTIGAVADACPQADEPVARAYWERGASRYREPSFEGRFSRLEQHTSLVAENAVGFLDDAEFVEGSRAYTRSGMEGAIARLATEGYASALPDSHHIEFFGAWAYPPIEAELAGNFAAEGFGAGHTFSLVSEGVSGLELRFCARDRQSSGLDGTLRLRDGPGFVDARWRFWNPAQGSEAAGGQVIFLPVLRGSEPSPLLSASGLLWRRQPSGRYLQRWQRYLEWKFD